MTDSTTCGRAFGISQVFTTKNLTFVRNANGCNDLIVFATLLEQSVWPELMGSPRAETFKICPSRVGYAPDVASLPYFN